MAFWFGRFSLVAFCFITLLCWNVCWLAGSWMLDFWQFCNQFLGLWCLWVSFGMLGASTLASWRSLGRSWDDPGTLGGTKKGLVRSRLRFYRFLVDFGDPFWELFWYFWTEKKQFFSYLFPGCFFCWFLGLNLGVWDWKNKHLAWKVLQKSIFAEIGFLVIPGSIFHDFG